MEFKINKQARNFIFGSLIVGILFLVGGLVMSIDEHLSQRLWSVFYYNSLFFMYVALGATFFLAIQYAAFAGWSTTILRIPEAISTFLPIGAFCVFLVVISSALHMNHLFHWMDPKLTAETLSNGKPNPDLDEILLGKKAFLNIPFFLIRIIIYLIIWLGFAHFLRKFSKESIDESSGLKNYKKNKVISVVFLVLFGITSSTSAWDLIMSLDSHWFSTLFGWYTFSSYFVTGIAVVLIGTIYLKSLNLIPEVNDNHIHDIGKFLFAFSVFWAYLFFSQFMLIWYANIPEEVTYFLIRMENYRFPFLLTVVINFVLPLLIFVARPAKRNKSIAVFIASIVIIGHWLDFFMMVTPASLGENWHFGLIEIGIGLIFLSGFIYTFLNSLTKTSLLNKNHPLLNESLNHHI